MSDSPKAIFGQRLRSRLEQMKANRRWLEYRWLDDLRQFKGEYRPEVLARLGKNRSRTFTKHTRIKVKAIDSRLIDLMFPGGTDKNWGLTPTPVSDMQLTPDELVAFQMQYGRPPMPEEQRALLHTVAAQRAGLMEQEIQDQLDELKWRRIMRQMVHSGNLYGMGVVKGPLLEQRSYKRWEVDPLSGQWGMQEIQKAKPYLEFVPIWDCYIDDAATEWENVDYVFQRHILNRSNLLQLANRPDFDGLAIRNYMREHANGDAPHLYWEKELRLLGNDINRVDLRDKRYELGEYWGVMYEEDFEALGLEEPPDAELIWVNAWILGSEVVKLVPTPIDGVNLPYHSYYYEKDETHIYGVGLARIMADEQDKANAAERATLDNAAICAGPQGEVNLDLLAEGEDPRDVYPFRIWLRHGVGAEAQYPAVRWDNMDSHISELLTIAKKAEDNIHELTVPAYMHGDAEKSVGRTVGGLSMLMSTAQIPLRDQMMGVDDAVESIVSALYHWNMQFNEREDIKGDYALKIRATTSLVAREVRSQALENFATQTLNEFDAPLIDRYELNKQRLVAQELPETLLKSREQIQAEQMAYAQQANAELAAGTEGSSDVSALPEAA